MDIWISGITKYAYCPIQYLLTYVLGVDDMNGYIVAGNIAHKTVDKYHKEKKDDGVVEYSHLAIHSRNYELYGYCDLVSFVPSSDGTFIPELKNKYEIYPVEYKVKYSEERDSLYRLQCILQALCLEEMYNTHITRNAIYYADINKRIYQDITEQDKKNTLDVLSEMKEFHRTGELTSPQWEQRCRGCAKYSLCFPYKNPTRKKSVQENADKYFFDTIRQVREDK